MKDSLMKWHINLDLKDSQKLVFNPKSSAECSRVL